MSKASKGTKYTKGKRVPVEQAEAVRAVLELQAMVPLVTRAWRGPEVASPRPSKGRSLSPEELQAAGMATTRELPAGYSRPRRRAQDWSPRARASKG